MAPTSPPADGPQYYLQQFNTCVYNAAAGHLGHTFTPPFYIEVTMSYGAQPGGWTMDSWWPIAWAIPTKFFELTDFGTTTFTEMDFLEAPFGRGEHDFTYSNNVQASGPSRLTSVFSPMPFGTLVIPTSMNAGTGIFNAYENGVLDSPASFTFAATGNFSSLNTQANCIMLAGGYQWPMTISSVKVWQLP